MSLADELDTEAVIRRPRRETPTEAWVREFYQTLNATDKKSWDAWVLDPTKSATALYRVMKSHGFPGGRTTVSDWVRRCRDENESG